jgi:mxaD protein
MTKTIFALALAALLYSCGGSSETKTKPTESKDGMVPIEVSSSFKIHAAAADVWSTVSDPSAVMKFAPMITDVKMDSNIRTCTLADGSIVKEEIVSTDNENMMVHIKVTESAMPMEGMEATMKITDNGDNTCEFTWTSSCTAAKDVSGEMKTMMQDVQIMAADGLKRLHMTHIAHSATINAPASVLWATISKFSEPEEWIPMIESSTMEGSGVGAERFLTLPDGSQIKEKLLALNNDYMTITYAILESPMPVAGYEGTMKVKILGENQSQVDWFSVFSVPDAAKEEITGMLDQLYQAGFEGLAAMHEAQ